LAAIAPLIHRILSLIAQAFWLRVWGLGEVEQQDYLLLALAFALSSILWAVLGRNARMLLWLMVVGILLCLVDRGILEILPRLQISHGRLSSGLWFMLLGRGIMLVAANGMALLGLGLVRLLGLRSSWRWGGWIVLVGQLLASAIFLDAWVVEPLSPRVSRLDIASPRLSPQAQPVRIVQVSDIHIVTYGLRERQVVARVNGLHPDLILLTGDYLNALSREAFIALQQMLGDLEASHGVYAVTGNVDLSPRSMSDMLEPVGTQILDNEITGVEVRGQELELVGLSASSGLAGALRMMDDLRSRATDRFRLLLAHYPDFITLSQGAQIDLALAGHTHGGQVRLPYHGALIIDSLWQEDYDMGRYDVGGTVLFVSRGVGFSGGYEPQVRFRCPPEVVLITLRGEW
jgi:predicted MPP superfamily phosphohydrolase